MGTFSGTRHLAPLVTLLEERCGGMWGGGEEKEGRRWRRAGMAWRAEGDLYVRDSLPPSQDAENLHFLSGRSHLPDVRTGEGREGTRVATEN